MDELLTYGRRRTVVVTGADSGLGFELVKQYTERGDRVFAGKYRENWHRLEKLKEQYPDRLDIVELDVSNEKSVDKAAEFILERTKGIDILINNAAVWLEHGAGTILDGKLDFEAIMAQININALGALRVTQALIHAVLNSFDQLVVNVSSEAASMQECSKDSQFGYCMSKAALNMASCIVLNGIRKAGGSVMNLHPGWMQSVIGESPDPDAPFVEPARPGTVKFYTTPEITAKGFLRILDEPERFSGHMPGFVNYRGDRMNW
ncbi:MAG TPA: SDR family NAD(P)-dependent oxidoreductase [Candidatus Limivivens intestinipullorum]|uniref:SDR family NAD(P)-dependent oxidoreductase n=1 Tax=Candidatus Limivivens intestinipullorum TaxID=2840858 RepID=A0A9D1JJ56_9FIRM|nr:SDR family NAD(P)-dependent oxidoreductase [Candidatus Limivivens intestinipullorum]